jgi:hypothetical protein
MIFTIHRALFVACILCFAVTWPKTAPAQEQPSQAPSQPSSQAQVDPAATEIDAVPNRPTIASTAEVVQPGVLELEYGFEGGDGHQNINGLVKFGLTKWLEVRVANNPILRDGGVFGTGDSGAGFKLRFFSQNEKWRPTFTLLYEANFPTASHNLGTQAYGHAVQLLVSKDFGKHHFDWNEGIQLLGRPSSLPQGYDRGYFSALSWSHPLRGKWAITAELAGTSKINDANPGQMTILFAPTYNVSSRLVLDAGAYVAAYGNLPRVTAFFGVTYSIADLYRHKESKPDHH